MKDVTILTNAIRNEDGDNMSLGSLRTLKLIENEFKLLQAEIERLKNAYNNLQTMIKIQEEEA